MGVLSGRHRCELPEGGQPAGSGETQTAVGSG